MCSATRNMCPSHNEKLAYGFTPSFHFNCVSVESTLFSILAMDSCGSVSLTLIILGRYCCYTWSPFYLNVSSFVVVGFTAFFLTRWLLASEVVLSGSRVDHRFWYVYGFWELFLLTGSVGIDLWPDLYPVHTMVSSFSHNEILLYCKSSKHVQIICPHHYFMPTCLFNLSGKSWLRESVPSKPFGTNYYFWKTLWDLIIGHRGLKLFLLWPACPVWTLCMGGLFSHSIPVWLVGMLDGKLSQWL